MNTQETRLADLEFRYAHQDAAIEELTRTVLDLQRTVERQSRELEYLRGLLREAAPAAVIPEHEEKPPPHY